MKHLINSIKTFLTSHPIITILILVLFIIFAGGPLFNFIATGTLTLHFITQTNYDAWISYYGAIVGGALTLGGVWWTIKDQERNRITELKLQYSPKILYKCSSDIECSYDAFSCIFKITVNDQNSSKLHTGNIDIFNLGDGSAVDFTTTLISHSTDLPNANFYNSLSIHDIINGQKISLSYLLPLVEDINDFDFEKQYSLTSTFLFTWKNQFKNQQFTQSVIFNFKIESDINEVSSIDDGHHLFMTPLSFKSEHVNIIDC